MDDNVHGLPRESYVESRVLKIHVHSVLNIYVDRIYDVYRHSAFVTTTRNPESPATCFVAYDYFALYLHGNGFVRWSRQFARHRYEVGTNYDL